MHSSKTKTGLSEAIPNKTAPATPKVIKLSKVSSKSDSNSSPRQNLRHSVNHSPRSVDSKLLGDRPFSKGGSPPHKQQRKPSEQQVQLDAVQDDLRKAKEQLFSLEKEKAQIIEELAAARKLADETNEKFCEALVAQKRAEESSVIEKFRADELEQVGIEADKKREEEWQKEVEAVRSQHAADVEALLSATHELQSLKNELAMTIEAKNAALGHAEDAMKIAEMNSKKAEALSMEVSRIKASLDSMLEMKSNEDAELVRKLHSEAELLKEELERMKRAEVKLAEMEALIKGLRSEVNVAKKTELDAKSLVDEMKKKVEILEAQMKEVSQSERSASESLILAKRKLVKSEALLQGAESEIVSLGENVESLKISLSRHKLDLDDSNRHLERANQEALEMKYIVENLKSELQRVKEDKAQAQNNEMLAVSSVQSLLDEKYKLIDELEASRDEEEKSKSAMESLASALHEISTEARDAKEKLADYVGQLANAESQIEDLKSAMEHAKGRYEPMLDKMKEEIHRLEDMAEKYQTEARCSKANLDEKELHLAKAIKRSEEEIDSLKRESDMLAENLKAEWHVKEVGFIASIKESEKEIIALKDKHDRLLNLLKETEEEAHAAKEDGEQVRNKLARAESKAVSAKEDEEKMKTKRLVLEERLLEKENELICVTQKNDDLQMREAAALDKVEELTKLLAEASVKKADESGELSNTEKSYDLLPKMVKLSEENTNASSEEENPNHELPLDNVEEREVRRVTKNADSVEGLDADANTNEKDDAFGADGDVKLQDKCNIVDKDLLPERGAEPESVDDELGSKVDIDSFDQMNGLPLKNKENGGSSPSKKTHRKKKPLLRKFGSLLKKSNPKSH